MVEVPARMASRNMEPEAEWGLEAVEAVAGMSSVL